MFENLVFKQLGPVGLWTATGEDSFLHGKVLRQEDYFSSALFSTTISVYDRWQGGRVWCDPQKNQQAPRITAFFSRRSRCLTIHFPSVKLGRGKQPKVTVAQNNCFSPKQSVLVKSCFFSNEFCACSFFSQKKGPQKQHMRAEGRLLSDWSLSHRYEAGYNWSVGIQFQIRP